MPLEIVTIPCLSDNYAYLLHNADSGKTALIDAPESAPIEAALATRGWGLTDILITHHHYDHVDGVDALRKSFSPRVIGALADAERLPALDLALGDGDIVEICGEQVQILDVPGHTIGHIAFYFAASGALFTADSLMALGCGRLFEGTPEMMLASLSKLATLPDETLVYSGHEYTAHNAGFALLIEPGNPELQARAKAVSTARDQGKATVPSSLALEKATNPFLRAHIDRVKSGVGMADRDDISVFAEIRERRNSF